MPKNFISDDPAITDLSEASAFAGDFISDEAPISGLPESIPSPAVDAGIRQPFERGAANLRQAFNVLQAQIPDVPLIGQDFAGAAADIAEAEVSKRAFAPSEATTRGLEEITGAEDFGSALGAILRNPTAVGSVLGESLVSSIPSLGLAALGATSMATPLAPAAPAFIGAGAGLGSAGVEFGTSVLQFAAENGIDTANPAEVERFFADPETSEQAVKFAQQRATGVGAFDALSGATAGRFFAPVRQAARTMGAGRRTAAIAGGAAETLAQAGAGAAGEATAQTLSGQDLNIGEITLEGIAEIIPGIGEIALQQLTQGKEIDSEQLKETLSRLEKVPLSQAVIDHIQGKDNEQGQNRATVDSVLDLIISTTDDPAVAELAQEIRKLSSGKAGGLVSVIFDQELGEVKGEYRPESEQQIDTGLGLASDIQPTVVTGDSMVNARTQSEAIQAALNIQAQIKQALTQGKAVTYIDAEGNQQTLNLSDQNTVIDSEGNAFSARTLVDGGSVNINEKGRQARTAKVKPVIAIGENGFNVEVILHETIHALTHQELPDSIRVTGGLTGQEYIDELNRVRADKNTKQEVRDIIDVFLKAKDALPDELLQDIRTGGNAMANIDEFLAEVFTNSQFQEELLKIASENRDQNLFQKLVSAIKGLIGINVSNTLLEDALISGARLIKSGKPSPFGKRKGGRQATAQAQAQATGTQPPTAGQTAVDRAQPAEVVPTEEQAQERQGLPEGQRRLTAQVQEPEQEQEPRQIEGTEQLALESEQLIEDELESIYQELEASDQVIGDREAGFIAKRSRSRRLGKTPERVRSKYQKLIDRARKLEEALGLPAAERRLRSELEYLQQNEDAFKREERIPEVTQRLRDLREKRRRDREEKKQEEPKRTRVIKPQADQPTRQGEPIRLKDAKQDVDYTQREDLEDLGDKRMTEDPLPQEAKDKMAEGSATVKDIMNAILQKAKFKQTVELAQAIFRKWGKKDATNFTVRGITKAIARDLKINSNYAGVWYGHTNEIMLVSDNGGYNAETFLHEYMHGLTAWKIDTDPFRASNGHSLDSAGFSGSTVYQRVLDEYLADPNTDEDVKALIRTFLEARKVLKAPRGSLGNPGKTRGYFYRLTNLDEFVVGVMTDTRIQKDLAKHKSTRDVNLTLWDEIVGIIANIVGLGKSALKNTLLGQAIEDASKMATASSESANRVTTKDTVADAHRENITDLLKKERDKRFSKWRSNAVRSDKSSTDMAYSILHIERVIEAVENSKTVQEIDRILIKNGLGRDTFAIKQPKFADALKANVANMKNEINEKNISDKSLLPTFGTVEDFIRIALWSSIREGVMDSGEMRDLMSNFNSIYTRETAVDFFKEENLSLRNGVIYKNDAGNIPASSSARVEIPTVKDQITEKIKDTTPKKVKIRNAVRGEQKDLVQAAAQLQVKRLMEQKAAMTDTEGLSDINNDIRYFNKLQSDEQLKWATFFSSFDEAKRFLDKLGLKFTAQGRIEFVKKSDAKAAGVEPEVQKATGGVRFPDRSFVFGEDITADMESQALALDKGINILRGKEINTVAVEDGEVVAASWSEYDSGDNEFSFDVAVSPESRRQGLATSLVEDLESEFFGTIQDMDPDAVIRVDVVNPNMRKLLEGRGYTVEEVVSDDRVIMVKADASKPSSVQFPNRAKAKTISELNKSDKELEQIKAAASLNARVKQIFVPQDEREDQGRGIDYLRTRLSQELSFKKDMAAMSYGEVQAVNAFLDSLPSDMVATLSLSMSGKKIPPAKGQYLFARDIIKIFRNAVSGTRGMDRTFIHEMWHHISQWLPESVVNEVKKQYAKERDAYIKENPWFKVFVGRGSLTVSQYNEALSFFGEKSKSGSMLKWLTTPQYNDRGNLSSYKLNFTEENYRFKDVDEWFAESMADETERVMEKPEVVAGVIAGAKMIFKSMLEAIRKFLRPDLKEKIFNDVLNGMYDRQRAEPLLVDPPVMTEGLGKNRIDYPLNKQGREIKDVAKFADSVYENPLLRPYDELTQMPVRFPNRQVKPIAETSYDTTGPKNYGRHPKNVFVRFPDKNKVYVNQTINQSETIWERAKQNVPALAKDGVGLAWGLFKSAVGPVFWVMQGIEKQMYSMNNSKEVKSIIARYKGIVDPEFGRGLQGLIEMEQRKFTSRLNNLLSNNGFMKGRVTVVMSNAEKNALTEALRTGNEIANNKELDNVAKGMRKLYDEMRQHMNAKRKSAYKSRIDAALKDLGKIGGARVMELVKRIGENRHKYGAMEKMKKDTAGNQQLKDDAEKLLKQISKDIKELNALGYKSNFQKETLPFTGKEARKINKAISAAEKLYEESQPIGFVSNYFPRRFTLQGINAAPDVFVERATKMFAKMKDLDIADKQREIDLQENKAGANKEGLAELYEELAVMKGTDPAKQAAELLHKFNSDAVTTFDEDNLKLQPSRKRKLRNDVVEEFLGDPDLNFMDNDPLNVMNDYIGQTARAGELIENFGNGGAFMKEDKEALAQLVDPKLVEEYFRHVQVATGVNRVKPSIPSAMQAGMSWFNGTIIITLLTRAVFNAFGEPLNVGMVTGSGLAGLKAAGGTMKAIVNGGDTQQWASLFESMGVIASGFDEITFTNIYNDTFDSPRLQSLMQRAFRMSGMAAMDRASRIAAGKAGHAFLLASARAHQNKKTMGKVDLQRFGIKEADMDAFAKWITDTKTMPHMDSDTLSADLQKQVDSGKITEAKAFEMQNKMQTMYARAVGSFIDTAIQNPKAVNKPFMASNPVGKIIFGLMSFAYSYQRNILGLIPKRVMAGLRGEIDGQQLNANERMQMAMMTVFPMIALYAGVAVISMIREDLADEDRLEELMKSKDPVNNFWVLAASRAGFFGAGDSILQAFVGVKYRRDLSNAIVGASTGYVLQSMGDIVRGVEAQVSGEATRKSNEKIVDGFYKLIVAPGVVAGSALLPETKMLTGAFGVFNALAVTSPGARKSIREDVIDLFE